MQPQRKNLRAQAPEVSSPARASTYSARTNGFLKSDPSDHPPTRACCIKLQLRAPPVTVPEFGSKITLTAMFMTGPDETFEAANGVAFTVRELFDIIVKYEATQREGCGPSDRVYFQGLEEDRRKSGCYSAFWGS